MKVFGFGERKTPTAFISACDKFIYIEILDIIKNKEAGGPQKTKTRTKPKPRTPPPSAPVAREPIGAITTGLVKLLSDSIDDLADESGWTFSGGPWQSADKKAT